VCICLCVCSHAPARMLVIYCNIIEKVERKLGHCEFYKVSSLGMVTLQTTKNPQNKNKKRQKHKKDKQTFLICHTSRLCFIIFYSNGVSHALLFECLLERIFVW
jgi:hypothetical protein